ncbi:glycosyltransferase family 25 protein [Enterovibrio paralichthyis]|uniref:glycosyltransferase family 25 protein n=1 Tax=Enterovibrio paralichthyis TaxID=2853805 RepID=UPI001C46D143|nr:glycosyltransferase family 25 protein [Enterovibrio paralichthyis]MBV7298646.1 glycosyltransferase family 25 protein [Enterovibrio paralichthyis]
MVSTKIHVISLKRSRERRELVARQMETKKLDFAFFDAVDGHQGTPTLAQDYDYAKRLWFTSGKMPSLGEVGCYASHYYLWLKCIELGHSIIVCEDDIELNENAAEIVPLALEQADTYGFIRLEAIEPNGKYKQVNQIGDYTISLMEDNYGGLRAYAISPSAAMRLIKHRWCLPVDCFVGANYIHGQYSYQLSPCLVVDHGHHVSTIQNADNNKTAIHRKPTRELYSLYKKWMLKKMYNKRVRELDLSDC